MTPAETQAKLRDGIQALRAGDRARGRRLLLEVVAADERIEPAWLWLSAALDDPADQIMALENALALNPDNAPARRRLAELQGTGAEARVSRGAAPPPAPAPATDADREVSATPAEHAASAVDPDDDPLQCPFCGQLTAEVDLRCPHCRKSLLAPGRWQAGLYLYLLLLIFGLDVQAAIVEAFVPVMLPVLPPFPLLESAVQFLQLQPLLALPWGALAARAILLAGLLFMFLSDVALAYPLAVGLLTLDVLANAGLWWAGRLSPGIALVNLSLSGPVLLLAAASLVSQALARRRLFTQLDRDLYSGFDYARRAQEHLGRGRLALAALHFRKAIALQPRTGPHYKALGLVQARLGRFPQARRALESGQALTPDDPEFAALIAEVERRAAGAGPRRP